MYFLKVLYKKIKWWKLEQKLIKTGQIYHCHCGEVVVSKNEALIQLQRCSEQTDLIKLLVYGRAMSDYEIFLMRVALKYEFLGGLVFPVSSRKTNKFPAKVYVKELFEGAYESIDEVKTHIERITGGNVSDEFAKSVFRKMCFVINTCCPLMAETCEIRWEKTYSLFIEYAIDNDDYEFEDEDNIWKLFPNNIPEKGNSLNLILRKLPQDFSEKVVNSSSYYKPIRW